MPTIAICGEAYSQNLGDGVIAESLGYLVHRALPSAKIILIDISNRVEWQSAVPNSQNVENQVVGFIRRVHRAAYKRFSCYRRLQVVGATAFRAVCGSRPSISDCDLMVIGGGQLLMDNDLNFPAKILLATRVKGGRARKIAFHSCGVGKVWTKLGRFLVGTALRDPRLASISVRDVASRDNVRQIFGLPVDNIDLVYDPACWVDEVYRIEPNTESQIIGLGIMASMEFASWQSDKAWEFCAAPLKELWLAIAGQLVRQGYRVSLFTNGSQEDQCFAEEIYESVPEVFRGDISICERPKSPEQLVKLISGFRAIVAQRLHAHIIAFSLGVPSIGFIWDSKVKEFGVLTGRSEFFVKLNDIPIEKFADWVRVAMERGVDPEQRRRLKENAYAGVVGMLERVGLTGISQ